MASETYEAQVRLLVRVLPLFLSSYSFLSRSRLFALR